MRVSTRHMRWTTETFTPMVEIGTRVAGSARRPPVASESDFESVVVFCMCLIFVCVVVFCISKVSVQKPEADEKIRKRVEAKMTHCVFSTDAFV